MKKIVLFILIFIFSCTTVIGQAGDFAMRVGDWTLSEEELNNRYYEKNARDRDKAELLQKFLDYAVMKEVIDQQEMDITKEDVRDDQIEFYKERGANIPENPIEWRHQYVDKTWTEHVEDLWTDLAVRRLFEKFKEKNRQSIEEKGEEFARQRSDEIYYFLLESVSDDTNVMTPEEFYNVIIGSRSLEPDHRIRAASRQLACFEWSMIVEKVYRDLEIEMSPKYEGRIEIEIPTR